MIAQYLLENLVVDIDCGRFIFADTEHLHVSTENNRVAATFASVQEDAVLIGHSQGRKMLFLAEIMAKMLTYPFFGRERHKLAPQDIENLLLAILCDDF